MKDRKELKDIAKRIEVLEQKISILEEKLEETKNFSFDQIRNILIRIMKLEEALKK